MTLNLQLSPDVEARLREQARLLGRSPEALVLDVLQEKLSTAVEGDDALSPSSRLAELHDWIAFHPVSDAPVLDDGRDSMYRELGE